MAWGACQHVMPSLKIFKMTTTFWRLWRLFLPFSLPELECDDVLYVREVHLVQVNCSKEKLSRWRLWKSLFCFSLVTHCIDPLSLPLGEYIVCVAIAGGNVYQASCFKTRIERLDFDKRVPCFQWHSMKNTRREIIINMMFFASCNILSVEYRHIISKCNSFSRLRNPEKHFC